MSVTQPIAAGAQPKISRLRLGASDRRDALLMSIGTVASGVLAYLFNVLAARSLGPEVYGAIGALWAGMFLIAVMLFRPIEQTVSRAISDQNARDTNALSAVRSATRLTVALTLISTAFCLLLWQPITDDLFGGNDVLTAALLVGVAGYAASYLTRGLMGGVRWFGGYGILLLADGGIRLLIAIPLIFIASPTVAAVAIAAAAIGGAIAPFFSSDRSRLKAISRGQTRRPFSMGATLRFALPVAVIAGCEQILISGGPLIVLIVGGAGAAATAGVLFAATLLLRAPVFLFQGVAASLLPNLTTFQARGESQRVRKASALVALILFGFAAILALLALAFGPWAMDFLYGAGFDVSNTDLAILALGVGGFLAAGTFCQALLAGGKVKSAALIWTAGAITFVTVELGLPGSEFHTVSVAFCIASSLIAALLMAIVWRTR